MSAGAGAGAGAAKESDLPWVEKYRPNALDELVSHEDIVSTIQRLIASGQLPHLLFYGPPGTGKTSTILACARQLYGKSMRAMTLELNASDARGIGVVRDQIQSFASRRALFSKGTKLVILDEADSMTNDAQFALRRVIEQYSSNTRFCIICNYASKIIPALQSRCTKFRFAPLEQAQMLSRTKDVITAEGLTVTDAALSACLRLSGGDMRKVLNVLQAAHMSFGDITEDAVYACTGKPTPEQVERVMQALLDASFADALSTVAGMQRDGGLALADLVSEVGTRVTSLDLPVVPKAVLIDTLADVEYNLSFATNERLQLGAIVGAFHVMRASLAASS